MDPLAYLLGLEKLGIKFGLDNIRTICRVLDNPQDRYRSIIVAGTNGKGSVTAMVERALRASGLRTARYTSPHLVRLEERFSIAGRPVSTAALGAAAADVVAAVEQLRVARRLDAQPTFFEVTTAIAFELFRRARIDLAVLEVGLGGRFDATNIVRPLAAAITVIDLDHERYLGSTIPEIAFEKAGVIKPGIPVVVGETKPAAVEVIARICQEREARFIPAAAGVEVSSNLSDGRTVVALRTSRRTYGPLTLALRGRHQVTNATVAVQLLEELEGLGIEVGREAIVAGLTDVSWPGRLDLIDLGEGRRVLFDAAHNPGGARALAEYLREVYADRLPLTFAAMRDKDAVGMLRALLPCARGLIVTQPRNPRATPADELAAMARAIAPETAVRVEIESREALRHALTLGSTVCVTGSIFLVGELLESIERRQPA